MTSSQCAFNQRKVVSQFEKWNEQPCLLIMPDLQELHWTNEIRATRLGYAAQTVYLLGTEPRAALDHATPLYTALGDTVKKVVEFSAESITTVKFVFYITYIYIYKREQGTTINRKQLRPHITENVGLIEQQKKW